ncbi:PssD/Cps14F family polysaccharide biosynthesis glycosyltransferase [Niallia sp. MER 6]|uniref:PssD/Cps14F family polysaccharide biosynthesis glycosyltransferase n=1 Tax=Niallia sp. MER 6 TaxID=2939567 RepID=UPI00203AD841|nr:PssD/Cps14F family polysaccharide biosynthesis glycosyltransferase [Niallia sp. MER 6]MCM3029816.1 UDP-N-acetylglucosamine transferase subunit ALG14 [Niallia sp. MER 6]
MKICFAASSGGHLEQIMMLSPLMEKYGGFVLTEKTSYENNTNNHNRYRVLQVNRRELLFLVKMILIFIQSLYIFIKEKPDIVISTGALATIPICLYAKIFKKKLIFIESFSKINSTTITGRLMYKFADLFIIQWEELREFYPKSTYGGGIY